MLGSPHRAWPAFLFSFTLAASNFGCSSDGLEKSRSFFFKLHLGIIWFVGFFFLYLLSLDFWLFLMNCNGFLNILKVIF